MAHPLHRALDDLMSFETENMAWLRRAGPIARRLNEESRVDGRPPVADAPVAASPVLRIEPPVSRRLAPEGRVPAGAEDGE